MSVRTIALAAAACVAATLSTVVPTPAVASDADIVVAPERITVRVSYADLDLGNVEGRAVLNRRIAGAARYICGSFFPADLDMAVLVKACREDTIASVRLPSAYASAVGGRDLTVIGNRMSRAAN
jgi:UrcA family protein